MRDLLYAVVPAGELGEDEVYCAKCKERLDNVCLCDEGYYCEHCIDARIARLKRKAIEYALKNCKITGALDHDSGSSDFNRHQGTNYDELIKPLDRDRLRDQVYYDAIRARAEQLVEEELERQEDEELNLWLGGEEQNGVDE